MDTSQNITELEPRHQAWVDHCAMGGMYFDVDGKPSTKTGEQLAKELKVSRRTLYEWRDTIPNFWDHVKRRRNELYARDAMNIIYKAMMKKAATGDVAAAKLMMAQARILEAEKIDHTTNGKDIPTPIFGGQSVAADDSKDV